MGYFFREEEQAVDPVAIAQMERATVKLMKVAEGVQVNSVNSIFEP